MLPDSTTAGSADIGYRRVVIVENGDPPRFHGVSPHESFSALFHPCRDRGAPCLNDTQSCNAPTADRARRDHLHQLPCRFILRSFAPLCIALVAAVTGWSADIGSRAKPTRLIHEKSPYLRQHAHNPVDWNPWGTEAFTRARAENKLIFLSVGYSTCHWCHVMERESLAIRSSPRSRAWCSPELNKPIQTPM